MKYHQMSCQDQLFDRWIDELTDRQMDEKINRQMDEMIDRWMYEQTDRQMDEQTDKQEKINLSPPPPPQKKSRICNEASIYFKICVTWVYFRESKKSVR